MDPAVLIKLSGVTKTFGSKKILKGIDLKINKGESLVLIGGSGTGKSLVLKCILGLVNHDKGLITFEDRDVTAYSDTDRNTFLSHFGMTFQKSGLFDSMLVRENVAFQLIQSRRCTTQEAKERAIDKLAAVGLDAQTAELFPAELSGGMQKRVGLARAIVSDPDVLLLDEPTAGLDPIMTSVINELILQIGEKLQATIVSITSDMSSLKIISDRVAMVHDGRIIWSGLTENVDRSDNNILDQFINAQEGNHLNSIENSCFLDSTPDQGH